MPCEKTISGQAPSPAAGYTTRTGTARPSAAFSVTPSSIFTAAGTRASAYSRAVSTDGPAAQAASRTARTGTTVRNAPVATWRLCIVGLPARGRMPERPAVEPTIGEPRASVQGDAAAQPPVGQRAGRLHAAHGRRRDEPEGEQADEHERRVRAD